MAQTPPRVIFTHIPKTAGTTMFSILQNLYQNKLFSLYGNAHEAVLFETLTRESQTNPNAIQAVSAHIPYGIHAYLAGGTWQYFTMLRDPMKRVLSLYYYVRQIKEHPHHHDSLTLPLEAYLQKYPHVSTIHTRYLLGLPQDNPQTVFNAQAPLPENALDIARQRLANDYTAFGLTERFDESLLLLREALGWRNIYYESRNITRSKRETLAPETMETLRQACAIDLALYDYAKGLFEERLQQTFGERLPAMLETFQRNNRIRSQARRVKNKVVHVVSRLKR